MAGLAVPIPYQWQVGDTGNAALLNAQLYNGLTYLLNPPAASYQQTSGQSLTSGSVTPITWPTPVLDLYGGYSAGTPTRYTGQVAGYYLISGSVSVAPNATGNRIAEIHKNGSGSAVVQGAVPAAGAANSTTVPVTGFVFLNGSTDYIELDGFQSSGGPLSTTASVTSLNIFWVHV